MIVNCSEITIDILLHGFEKYQERLGSFVCDTTDLTKIHSKVFEPENSRDLFELGLSRYKNLKKMSIEEHIGICLSEREKNNGVYTCEKCYHEERQRIIKDLLLETEEMILIDL